MGTDYINGSGTGIDDNDSFDDAAAIVLTDGLGSVSGNVNGAGTDSDTDDYFSFTADRDGDVTITLSSFDADELYLRLYDSFYSQVAVSEDDAGNEVITFSVTAGETYYIRVDPVGDAESDYDLAINTAYDPQEDAIDGATVAGGDAGGDMSSAAEIDLASDGAASISGSTGFDGDDDDYYQFTAWDDGDATFDLTGLSAALNIRLYDAEGTLVGETTVDDATDKQLIYAVTAGETYYIRIDPYDDDDESDYDLTVSSPGKSTNDYVNGDKVDGGDAGADTDHAEPVYLDASGSASIEGHTSTTDTDDYYEFTALDDGTATVTLTNTDAGSASLAVYDGSGAVTDHNADDLIVEFDVTAGTTYWIGVTTSDDDTYYSLEVASPEASKDDYINGSLVDGGDAGNDYASATEVPLDDDGDATITGSAGFDSDSNDYYRFTALGDGTATFTLSDLSEALYMRLYDEDGQRVAMSENLSSSDDKTLTFDVVTGETYYLRVDPHARAESTYTLEIDTPDALDQDYINGVAVGDGDAGDTTGEAETVTLASDGSATMVGLTGKDSDDADAYTFEAIGNGTATFSLTGLSDDLSVALYDSGGSLIDSTVAGTGDQTLTYDVDAFTTYTLVVTPDGAAESTYRLTIASPEATKDDYIGDNLVDEGDAGNDYASASEVPLDINGDATITGSAGYDSDSNDYYCFTALGDGTATFSLSGLSASLYMRLYNEDGQRVAMNESYNTSEDKTLTYEVTAGETYYLRVDPHGRAESTYTLEIDTPEVADQDYINGVAVVGGDAGDSTGDAETVTLASDGSATIVGLTGRSEDDDADAYTFEALGSGTATFSLTGLSDNASFTLYDSGGSEIDSTSAGSGDQTLTYDVDAFTTYTLVVTPDGDAESTYRLTIASPEASKDDYIDGVLVDGGDAGNDQDSATVVDLDVDGSASITGSAGYDDDGNDYYQFTVQDDGDITLALTGLSGALFLKLYSSDGRRVAMSDDVNSSDDKTLTYEATAGETYIVRVDPYGRAESTYTLDISSPGRSTDDYVDGTAVDGGDVDAIDETPEVLYLDPDGAASIDGYTGTNEGDSGDAFQFTALDSDTATFTLSDVSGSVVLTLYDSNKIAVAQDTSGESGDSIQYSLTDGATYYVSVAATDGSYYTLDVSTPGMDMVDYVDGVAVDGDDAGDTRAEAAVVDLDDDGDATITGTTGYDDDSSDVYQFTANEDGTATFDLDYDFGDLDLMLYDGSGAELTLTADGDNWTYDVEIGETYYLAVEPAGDNGSDYTLSIDSPALGSGDYINGTIVDGGDASNSLSSPETVASGDAQIQGTVNDGSDFNDYYQLTSDEDNTSPVVDFTDTTDEDIVLRFYDESYNLLAEHSGNVDFDLDNVVDVNAGDVIILGVQGDGDASASYGMDISFDGF